MSTTTKPSYVQPALVGGAVMGVLSALPLIYLGNLCCCLWVVSGGVVAAYVLQQNQAGPIAPGDGALVGLLAGLVGAGVHFVLAIPIDILMAPMERAMAQRFIDMTGSMSPEMRDMFDRMSGSNVELSVGIMLIRRVVGFMLMLFIGAIFSTLGGLLGAALFRKPAPPAVVDVTPGV
ncbi:MAG: DUF4199 domain-containing protein [Acidobacteria bacterium]|nr:DUF4199 domain-containing protein [Acidobacteriota bacterium]